MLNAIWICLPSVAAATKLGMLDEIKGVGMYRTLVMAAVSVFAVASTLPANAQTMPRDEQAFIAVVTDSIEQYEQAKDDFAKGATRPARKEAICRALRNLNALNWYGKITKISTNGEGRGVVAVSLRFNYCKDRQQRYLRCTCRHPHRPEYAALPESKYRKCRNAREIQRQVPR